MAPYLVGSSQLHLGKGRLCLEDREGASGQQHLATVAAMHQGDASA
jgi:hypothetical protein